MLEPVAVLCAAISASLLIGDRRNASRRLAEQLPRASSGHAGRLRAALALRGGIHPDQTVGRQDHLEDQGEEHREVLLRRIASCATGALCLVTVGGVVGLVLGALIGAAVWYSFGRSERAERKRRRARLIADLPVAVDLLAACLRGGTPWHEAVEAVADAVGGPLGEEFRSVAARIRLGADPAAAWLTLAKEPTLAPLARAAVRGVSSGAALAPSLSRLARDQRRVARTAAAARARAVGVRALAPLGLCFLPSFVLLALVPAIAGIATTILLP
ncbi:type II secretion system F family protein [Spirillospora albida]|uniref:type II secretion system F family protein n=1 Tax=Spirillospora albida TaxID=58123 RepID=UPI000A74340A|nr:type II secretion system F family protein [Spirillospora albida]